MGKLPAIITTVAVWRGPRLRFPLPGGEGQGEGLRPFDAAAHRHKEERYPLTPALSPWERERFVALGGPISSGMVSHA